jgi:hypothetical protein
VGAISLGAMPYDAMDAPADGAHHSDGKPPATLYVPTNTRSDDAVQNVFARRLPTERYNAGRYRYGLRIRPAVTACG